MRQMDYEVRYRLERFRATYEAGGNVFDMAPLWVNCGFNDSTNLPTGSTTTRIVRPAKDFPYLWLGVSMQSTQAPPRLQPAANELLKFTILKSGQLLGDDKSQNGAFNNAVALQNMTGYDGKAGLFAYPYLFEAHDELQVQVYADDQNAISDPIVLIGYKILPRA